MQRKFIPITSHLFNPPITIHHVGCSTRRTDYLRITVSFLVRTVPTFKGKKSGKGCFPRHTKLQDQCKTAETSWRIYLNHRATTGSIEPSRRIDPVYALTANVYSSDHDSPHPQVVAGLCSVATCVYLVQYGVRDEYSAITKMQTCCGFGLVGGCNAFLF